MNDTPAEIYEALTHEELARAYVDLMQEHMRILMMLSKHQSIDEIYNIDDE